MHIKNRLWTLALACGVAFSSGCLTRAQVAAIVAESNAALVSPYINDPEGTQSDDWQKAVAKIDELIAANPENEVLVSQMRLRQALLFTVNKKPALAEKRWEQVSGDKLKNERDRALHSAYKGVIRAYNRGLPTDYSDKQARADIEGALEGVEARPTRVFLRMLQASILLHEADALDDESERVEIQTLLGEPIDRFVAEFSESERAWVKAGGTASPEDMPIMDIRHGVWLARIVKEAHRLAKDVSVDAFDEDAEEVWPDWSPATLDVMGRTAPGTATGATP